MLCVNYGFPWWLSGKESTCNARDMGSIPGWGRSPGEEHGNPLQCCCLENTMDRGAWWATGPEVTKSQTRLKQRHTYPSMYVSYLNKTGKKNKTKINGKNK